MFSSHDSPRDRAILEAASEATGAVIMGRSTFDFVDGPHGWDEEVSYGYDHRTPSQPPVFVLTHQPPENPRLATGFTFVTAGIEAAVAAARDVAAHGEVYVMGGAHIIDQALAAGLVDELRIHLSPVVMGSGTRLFASIDEPVSLTQRDVVVTPHATHLTYDVG